MSKLPSRFIKLTFVGLALLTCIASQLRAQDSTAANKSHVKHSIEPSLGITLETISSADEETVSAVWLAGLQGNLFIDGEPWQLGAKLYSKYGQQHGEHQEPKKTQDDLIVSVTPSRTIVPSAGIRLFLETTLETQMAKGIADDSIPTKFLDPGFIYQSLFLGKRFSGEAEDGSWQYDLTTGVGYALQETFAQNFILNQNRNLVVTEHNPLSSVQNEVTLESGYSAIVDFNYQTQISDNLSFSTGWKTVGINRVDEPSLKPGSSFLMNTRVTSLLLLSLQYRFLSLDYSGHLTYDRNVSLRRSLEQSLVFGFKLKF